MLNAKDSVLSKGTNQCLLLLIGVVPALLIGGAAFWIGNQGIDRLTLQSTLEEPQASQNLQLMREQQQKASWLVLIGAMAVSGMSGILLWILLSQLRSHVARQTSQLERQWTGHSFQLLNDFITQMRSVRKPKEILNFGVEEVQQALKVQRVVILGLDSETTGKVLAESVQSGYSKALNTDVYDPCLAERSRTLETNAVKVISDIDHANLPDCYLNFLQRYQVKASLSVPIQNQGKLGFLIAHDCERSRNWTSTEIELFANIATIIGYSLDYAALVLKKKQLTHQLQEEVQWKNFMVDATQYIHESSTVEDVLNAAVDEIRRVMECDRVVVYSVDRINQGVIIAESVARGFPRILGRTINDPCFEERYIQAYSDGRVRALNDIHNAGMTDCYIEQLDEIAVKANLVAPVIHEGRLLGLLVAHQCSSPRQWRDLEIRWFTQMAIQVGYALDNAKLISRVDEMALATNKIKKEHQVATFFQIEVRQKLQTIQVALSDIWNQINDQAQSLTLTGQTLETASTHVSLMRGTSKTIEQQLQQIKSVMQKEAQTLSNAVENLVDLDDNLSGLTANGNSLQQLTQYLAQELTRLRDLATQLNSESAPTARQAYAEREQKGLESKNSTLQVESVIQAIKQQTNNLIPLTTKVRIASGKSSEYLERGIEQLANSQTLAQDMQQKLNHLEGMDEYLSQLVEQFDKNTSEHQSQIISSNEMLRETVVATRQTLHQLEQVIRWFAIDQE